MEKMTSWASFIHKDRLGGEKSYKSQTGEMVPVLTGTDLLPSPQGHKVSLLMHTVKGNLANTVCKRKHQHIASVPVLGGPCMLFSNFDPSFFFCRSAVRWMGGQGVCMDFFFPPSHPPSGVTLTQSQGEVTPVTGPCASWPTKPNDAPDNRGFAGVGHTPTHTFRPGGDLRRLKPGEIRWQKSGPRRACTLCIGPRGEGGCEAILKLILFQSILPSCADSRHAKRCHHSRRQCC